MFESGFLSGMLGVLYYDELFSLRSTEGKACSPCPLMFCSIELPPASTLYPSPLEKVCLWTTLALFLLESGVFPSVVRRFFSVKD